MRSAGSLPKGCKISGNCRFEVNVVCNLGRNIVKKGNRKFSADETATFCSQIAMLLNGGITLYEGMDLFYEELEDKAAKDILKSVDDRLTAGSPLSEALRETGAFPYYMIQMTEVGERTGKLEEVMTSLAAYYERESAVRSGVKNVITYPIMLFSMMAVILLVLVLKILPMFEAVFNELDNKTSGTEAMMSTGLTVSRVAACIVFAVVLILLMSLVIYRLRNGADDLSSIINTLPFTAGLSNRLGKGRFLAGLSLMVNSGMETGEAVERAAELPDDPRTLEMAGKACEMVKAGASLDEVLCGSEILSGMEGRMLNVGIKSGVADRVLEKLSDRKDEEIGEKLGGLSAKIEVALVLFLSVLVGVILLTVLIPLISVIASI